MEGALRHSLKSVIRLSCSPPDQAVGEVTRISCMIYANRRETTTANVNSKIAAVKLVQ